MILLVGALTLGAAQSTEAQSTEAQSSARPTEQHSADEQRGWLFRSALLNVGKPEVSAPSVELNADGAEQAIADGQRRLMKPFYRFRDAALGAVERTRAAWNGAVERMKFRGDGGAPPMLARWFGESAPPDTGADTSETFRR